MEGWAEDRGISFFPRHRKYQADADSHQHVQSEVMMLREFRSGYLFFKVRDMAIHEAMGKGMMK